MIKNRDSLKAKIRNIADEKKIPNMYLLQRFMFESLLRRISVSKYRDKFIIKGGLLIASIFGIDLRSTMDMDATIKGIPLEKEIILMIFTQIIKLDVGDAIILEIVDI